MPRNVSTMRIDWHGPSVVVEIKTRVAEATRRIADAVLAEATRQCPVDTGALRASGRVDQSPDGEAATISYDTHYAAFVHDGTSRQSPNPWLTRAMIATQDEAKTILQDIFG